MSSDSEETTPQSALFPPLPPEVAPSSMPCTSGQAPRPMNVALPHRSLPPPSPYPAVPSTSTSQQHNPVHRGESPQPSTSYAAMQYQPPLPCAAVPSTSTSQLHNPVHRGESPQPSTSYAAMQYQPPLPDAAVPSTSTSQLHNPVHRSESLQPSTSSAISHPPMTVPMFDATLPPTATYAFVEPSNKPLKRKMSTSWKAGPSKLRRGDQAKDDDRICDACVQRKISIENLRRELEQSNSEFQRIKEVHNEKLMNYEKHREFLFTLVGSDTFKKIAPMFEPSTMPRSPDRSDVLKKLHEVLHGRLTPLVQRGYREMTSESAYKPGTTGLPSYRHYSDGQHVEQLANPPLPVSATSHTHYPSSQTNYPHPYQQEPRPSTSRAPVSPRRTHAVPHTLFYTPEPRPSTSRAPMSPRPIHAVPYTTFYTSEPRPSTSRAPVSPRPIHAVPYTTFYTSEPRPSTSRAPVSPRPIHAVPYTTFYTSEPRPSTSRAPVSPRPIHAVPYTTFYTSEPRPSTSRAPVSPRPIHAVPYTTFYSSEPRPSTSRAPVSPRPIHAVPYTTFYQSEPRPSTSRAPVSPRPIHAVPYTTTYPF